MEYDSKPIPKSKDKKDSMKKILVFSTDWEHLSIAKAVKEAIEKNHKVSLHSIPAARLSKDVNDFMYKFIPRLFKFFLWTSNISFMRLLFDLYAQRNYGDRLNSVIIKSSPNIVINTYFAFNSPLEKLRAKYKFRLINVFANPWTFGNLLISPDAENLVFDEYSWRRLQNYMPKITGSPIGWFTENKFYEAQKTRRDQIRKSLNLNPDKFTLCITSGSEGTFNIFKIISTFLNPRYDMQVLMMCGNNKNMLSIAKTLKKLSQKIRGPEIIGISYTSDIHGYLRASDLVVGKAGPNTLFESVATLTPFFAISHLSGLEDGSLDIIKRYKIGYIEENPRLATQKLKEIIENPTVLGKFTKNLKSLSKFCQGSGERLLALLKP